MSTNSCLISTFELLAKIFSLRWILAREEEKRLGKAGSLCVQGKASHTPKPLYMVLPAPLTRLMDINCRDFHSVSLQVTFVAHKGRQVEAQALES